MRFYTAGGSCLILGIAMCLVAGCGKESPLPDVPVKTPTIEDVKQAATNTVESVKQQVSLSGSMELSTNVPVKASGCYVRFASVPGKARLLQVTSYNDPTNEGFPSVMLVGQPQTDGLSSLAGQTIPMHVFVKPAANQPGWRTPEGQPAQIRITESSGQNLVGEVVSGTLLNAATGATAPLGGTFRGKVQ